MYAEVIGDPVAQSKSPIIHKYWLERLGLKGDYRRTRVAQKDLARFLAARRAEPEWRGCNVTIPHKQAIIPLLDRLDADAAAIGAVNCVVPEAGVLVGYNSDVDGVAVALDPTALRGKKAVLIGSGGAARAVLAYLAKSGAGRIDIVARTPDRAELLRELVPDADVSIRPLGPAGLSFAGAAAIINASSLGMAGAEPMPQFLLDALRRHAAGATIFDLVTTPAETGFLLAGRAAGGHCVDGIAMLVGQASRAFHLFFGIPAPAPDETLRRLLATECRPPI